MQHDGNVDQRFNVYRASSVYQKPVRDIEKDWMYIDKDTAHATLRAHTRTIPWQQIKMLHRKIDDIRAVSAQRVS